MKYRKSVAALAIGALAVSALSAVSAVSARQSEVPAGAVWRRVPHDPEAFGGSGDQVPADVVATGDGFITIGNDSAGPLVQPVVWLSEDGATWQRIDPGPVVADPDVARRLDSVAANAAGIVAIGTEGIDCVDNFDLGLWGACERTRQAAWWSLDGVTWNRADGPFDDAGDSTMAQVVATDDGFYAIGNRRLRNAWDVDVFSSTDGRTWQRVHTIDRPSPVGAMGIVAGATGVIAFAREHVGREVTPSAATVKGGGWVITGADPGTARALVSTSTAGGPFVDADAGLADDIRVGTAWTSGATTYVLGTVTDGVRTILASPDGLTWTPLRASDLFTQTAFAAAPRVFPSSDGLIGIQFTVIDEVFAPSTWDSADGASWQAGEFEPSPLARVDAGSTGAGGSPGGVAEQATDGTTFVAVGVDATRGDADAAFWYSTAGLTPEVIDDGGGAAGATYSTPDGCELTADAECPYADLDGADLAGLAAAGADLTAASLAGANLVGADLRGAILDAADLRGANLTDADLTGASLEVARLDDAILDGAILTDVVLEVTDFSGASLRGVQAASVAFGGTIGVGAILEDVDLTDAALASSDLSSVVLRGADLSGADLTGANGSGAFARGAIFTGARLQQSRFSAAELTDADFSGVLAREASFTLADLRGANITGADLTDASLFAADLAGADLTDAAIPVTNFLEADLSGVFLPAEGLDGADWGETICPDGFTTGQYPSASCAGHEVVE